MSLKYYMAQSNRYISIRHGDSAIYVYEATNENTETN